MKKIWLCAALLGSWPTLGLAQTTQELVNDGKNTASLNHAYRDHVPTFAATLTTIALNDSSLQWLEAST